MSELKAVHAYRLTTNTEDYDVYIHNDEFGCGGDLVECYLKEDADKVIADLEESHKMEVEQLLMEIAKLKSDIADLRDDKKSTDAILDERNAEIAELKEIDSKNRSAYYKDLAMMAKDVEHHKYKRCRDEAKICQLCLERYERYVTKYKDCNSPSIQRWKFLKDHYEKWYIRWLELAEKFKEATNV